MNQPVTIREWLETHVSKYRNKSDIIKDCALSCNAKESSVRKKLNSLKDKNKYFRNLFSDNRVRTEELAPIEYRKTTDNLIKTMLSLSRGNVDRLNEITKAVFLKKANLRESELTISFSEIKAESFKRLLNRGLHFQNNENLGEGLYVVLGDSHGKHTKKGIFKLLNKINKTLDVKNIIHIGHILDDDNDISYLWEDIKNLIVLGKKEELPILAAKKNLPYRVIRGKIYLGELTVQNQEQIQDHVKTSLESFPIELSQYSTIVNLHRHELFARPWAYGDNIICSPGCLCERHIIKTIKQIDWKEGKITKVTYPEGYIKYRRMEENNIFWEQGLIFVHINEDGEYDIIPSRIHKTSKGYAVSYFDKIISERGVFNPHSKTFVTGDEHTPKHDNKIFDIQNSVIDDYKPDNYVSVGDFTDGSSISHHDMKHCSATFDRDMNKTLDYMEEMAQVNWQLKKKKNWAKNRFLLKGNHERFHIDFIKKYPQLRRLLDVNFMANVYKYGYHITDHKDVLHLGPVNYIHGDLKFYNTKGNLLEKASKVFGHNTIMGHLHRPAIRFGCYMVPLSGSVDQGYNESIASNWVQGFLTVNTFDEHAFITPYMIRNYRISINSKEYYSTNSDEWKLPDDYDVSIEYSYDRE